MTSRVPNHRRKNRKATLIGASVVAAMSLGVAVANGSGGVDAPSPPSIKDLRCLDRCLDVRVVAETGIVELTGKDLGAVKGVRLSTGDGKAQVTPKKASSKRVEFKVPVGAVSGKPLVVDSFGNRVRSPIKLNVKPADRLDDSGNFKVKRAEATPAKSFFNGKRQSRVEYLFAADGRTDIRIDVVKGKRKRVVDSIIQRDQKPFSSNTATWDGLAGNNKVAPNGKYKFEVSQLSGGDRDRAGFRYYDHRFPIAGKHGYGDGIGAGRGHQGQDVFAKCGNPIYAARGGRVQVKASHSAAGNYVVIDGRKTGVDYVYMHLERGGRPKEGSKVRTGEVIGYNSDTGRATGCHLHFEMWTAPGWYEGGKPISPTKHLKRWDRWS